MDSEYSHIPSLDDEQSGSSDSLKLFIGQLPYSCDDNKLRSIFSEFGEVLDLVILRDRNSGASKGCAFVTMAKRSSAEKAIAALHDSRRFGEGTHPLQVKPADSEGQKLETKLFVGLLPLSLSEEGLRAIFAPFGPVEDVTILRNADGGSRRCGFVRYATHAGAQAGIEGVHQRITPPDGTQALVVRFADNDRQKQMRKIQHQQQQQQQQQGGMHGMMPMPMGFNPMMGAAPMMGGGYGMAGMPQSAAFVQQAQQAAMMQQQQQMPYGQIDMNQMAMGAGRGAIMGNMRPSFNGMPLGGFGGPAGGYGGRVGGGNAGGSVGVQHRTGPEGANLFIYNLAPQQGDMELAQMFAPFGNVVSAKVFTDKATHLSKCFGFISFDNPSSAEAAISNMDGTMLPTGKRLKVQHKTKKDSNSPYSR